MSSLSTSKTSSGGEPGADNLAVLLEQRHRLETLLTRHQAEVISGRWGECDKLWLSYYEGMERSICEEEEFILPLFQDRVPQTRKGLMEIFLAEHIRIRAFLSEISGLLDLIIQNPPPAPSQVVHLLEREYELKRLIEHHDTRDRNILIPELDKSLTASERVEILSRLHR